jgi:hypothetical protein
VLDHVHVDGNDDDEGWPPILNATPSDLL